MACCYIAAICVSRLLKACKFLDLDFGIQLNENIDPTKPLGIVSQERQSQAPASTASSSITLSLAGLTCASCVQTVTTALEAINGVEEARLSLLTQEAVVFSSGEDLSPARLIEAVQRAGYDCFEGARAYQESLEIIQFKAELKTLRNSFLGFLCCGATIQIVYQLMEVMKSLGGRRWSRSLAVQSDLVIVGVAIFCQWEYAYWIYEGSWRILRAGHFNMNSLITLAASLGICFSITDLAVVGASANISYATSVTGLTMVVTLGRYLEVLSRRHGSQQLEKLYKSLSNPDLVRMHPSNKVRAIHSSAAVRMSSLIV